MRIAPRSKDPTEQKLREEWHALKAKSEGSGDPRDEGSFAQKHNELAAYLWNRVQTEVAEDRKRHPKKKRNLPVSREGVSGGRVLP
jgi:hypothetical protein